MSRVQFVKYRNLSAQKMYHDLMYNALKDASQCKAATPWSVQNKIHDSPGFLLSSESQTHRALHEDISYVGPKSRYIRGSVI